MDIKLVNKKIRLLELEIDYLKTIDEIDQKNENNNTIKEKKLQIKGLKQELEGIKNSWEKQELGHFKNQIICGDCNTFLEQIPNDSVHLFVSDIPYGISLDEWDVLHNNTNSALLGASPAQEGKSAFKRRGKPINGWNKDDRNINREYEEWVFSWAQKVLPLMKEGAPLFIFGARRTISAAISGFERAGFLLKDILAWEKSNAHHRSQDVMKVLVKRASSYKITQDAIEEYLNYPELALIIGALIKIQDREFNTWNELIKEVAEIDGKISKKYTYEILEAAINDDQTKMIVKKWKGWKLGNLAPYYEPIAWFMKPYDSVVTLTDNILLNEVGGMNMNISKIDGKDPKNILKFDYTPQELKHKFHEAQKPVELIKYLINLTTIEGQLVLDPFVGSGTTAAACKETNRNFIAFEIVPEYHQKAVRRIEAITEENMECQLHL